MSTNTESATTRPVDADGDALLRRAWRSSRPGLVAIGVFSVFINVLKLATPLYVLQILDRVIASRSLETLFMLTTITLVAIVCGVLLEVVRRRMFMHWGGWIERSFGPTLFTAGLRKDSSQAPTSSKSLRDVATVRSFVAGPGLIAWLDLVWAPVFIGIVYLIAPALGHVVLICSLIALALGAANELLTRDSRSAAFKAGKADREWVASAERDRETVGSLNIVHGLTGLWSRSAFKRLDESARSRATSVYFAAGMRLVGRFVRIGILGIGVWLVVDDVLTLGAVIAAGVLGRIAYSLVQNAMLKWRDMAAAKRAYDQIKASLAKDKAPALSKPSAAALVPLVLDDVAYRYPNRAKFVLRRLTTSVEPGDLLCVIGPSASGKSTFCRLVSGLLTPRSGKIRLGDVDVYRLQQNSAQREIGFLPQEITLFQGTVRENIAGMSEGDLDEVVAAAKLAGIHTEILRLPKGYDTEIVDKEPLLSAGQRKSIAVARAFYAAPPLIVMDEPMPHLDAASQKALTAGIKQLRARGTIVVLTTQRKGLARIADKVFLLREQNSKVLETREEIDAMSAGSRNPSVRSGTKDDNKRRRGPSKHKNLRSV